jgi:hypothetical protein
MEVVDTSMSVVAGSDRISGAALALFSCQMITGQWDDDIGLAHTLVQEV